MQSLCHIKRILLIHFWNLEIWWFDQVFSLEIQNLLRSQSLKEHLTWNLGKFIFLTQIFIISYSCYFYYSCTATRNVQKECIRKADAFFILPPVSSAKINTKKSFKFRYGKVEIKAKVPKGDWIFPQLNLEPAELIYGSDYFASGLLRIGMVRGNEVLLTSEHQSIGGEWLCGGAVLTAGSQFRDTWMKCTMGDKLWSDDFHTYGLEWTDEAITLSVDGKTYGEPLSNNLKRSAHSRNIVHSSSWKSENKLSPFDQEVKSFFGDYQDNLSNVCFVVVLYFNWSWCSWNKWFSWSK